MLTQQSDSSLCIQPPFLDVSTHTPQIKQTVFQIHWKGGCLECIPSEGDHAGNGEMPAPRSLKEKVLTVPLVPLASRASQGKGFGGGA